ncbi:MAG: SPOR domain-containing protein [Bacteroidales bacterium]|nr:SPOR domain-containing protein [Bacteroidales bacterium]
MEDYKNLLTELYKVNDPERIRQIDYFLEKYKGKEKQFYISQKAKYKQKKPVSDSKKIIEEALARIKTQSDDKEKAELESKLMEESAKTPEKKTTETIKASIPTPEPEKVTQQVEKEVVKEIKKEDQETSKKETEKYTQTKENQEKEIEKESVERTAKAEKRTVMPPPIETSKKEVWFDKKTETGNPAPIKKSASIADPHFKKKYFLYIFGMVLLIIILLVVAYFIFFYNPGVKTHEAKAKPETTIIKEDPVEKTSNETSKEVPVKKEPAKTNKAASTNKTFSGVRLRSGDLHLPSFFVACYAVKQESLAQTKVKELTDKGFDAKYYWIPDFVPNGNKYFKVVVGPYNSIKEAMLILTPVQERAEFDAYVLELK